MAARQKRLTTPRHLLDDELAEPMRQWDESSPRLLRPRGSSTGSLFREEVWPPPQEAFHDPIVTPHDLGSTVSLVMGPPPPESAVSPSLHRSSNDGAVAVNTATAVGAGKRAIRAYDASSISSSSAYSYDNHQPESGQPRAMSADPLLPRNTSSPTPPLAPMRGHQPNPAHVAKVQEATNQRWRVYRRSTLSESFTPMETAAMVAASSPPPSSYPRPSHSRWGYSAADAYTGSSIDTASEDSELLRAVLTAGSSADLALQPRSALDLPEGAPTPANESVAPTPLPDEPPPHFRRDT
jgi:hypothetical protein